jgi:hypothetical protein
MAVGDHRRARGVEKKERQFSCVPFRIASQRLGTDRHRFGTTKKGWKMMRVLIAASLAASMYTTSLLAADMNAPLPPAKAAGVQNAQIFGTYTPLIVIGIGIGIVAAVVLSNTSPASIGNTVKGLPGTTTTST